MSAQFLQEALQSGPIAPQAAQAKHFEDLAFECHELAEERGEVLPEPQYLLLQNWNYTK